MNYSQKYSGLLKITVFLGALISPLLTACSTESEITSAGIGGTGITQGKITGFGSIFVNGIEFDTNQSQFEVDGDTTLTESDLSIGMVVKITGNINSNGLEGIAENVEYDDEVQGPIATMSVPTAGQKTLTIFGHTVIIDESTTSFDGTSFNTIKQDDIVEISGFRTSTTEIEATFVKKTGIFEIGEDVELKGTISSLTSNSFKFGTITITYDNDTEIEDGIALADGLFVEVEGELQNATSILAKEIEAEDEDFEEGDKVSLQGVISNLQGDLFTINGQQVDAGNAELSPANTVLSNGLNVEVEGSIVNGVLIAEELELREGEARLQASVFAVDLTNKRIEFRFLAGSGSVFVVTDNQTEFEDESASSGTFSLSQVMPNDFLKIEGIGSGNQIIAHQVKKLEQIEDTVVQGAVEFFTGTASIDSITLFGVTFDVGNGVLDPGIAIGDIVEIKDEDPADGLIDEISLED